MSKSQNEPEALEENMAPETQAEERVELTVVDADASEQDSPPASVKKARFAPLEPSSLTGSQHTMDLLLDVQLDLSVELGRSAMPVKEVLQLGPGSVVELDKLGGEPVDVLVNGRLIARGEVVVVDENFGVRITEIVGGGQSAVQAV
jgi:flagellar motor switch protein FliN